mgnify:CR=1 FL=1
MVGVMLTLCFVARDRVSQRQKCGLQRLQCMDLSAHSNQR